MVISPDSPSNQPQNSDHQCKFTITGFLLFITGPGIGPSESYRKSPGKVKNQVYPCFVLFFRERSLMKTIDTSEETSDTCVDEHHDVSSGPPSGPVEFFHVGHQAFVATAAGVTPKPNRRSRSNHSPSKSPSWRRPNQNQRLPQIEIPDIKTLERTARSRDSGINDQRESLSLSCSCNNDTSCGSCSDHSDEHNMNRTNPQRHSTTR